MLPLSNYYVVSSFKFFTVYKFLLCASELLKSISLLVLYWIMVIVLHFLLNVSHLLNIFFALFFKPSYHPLTSDTMNFHQVCFVRNNWNGRMQVRSGEDLEDRGRDGSHPCECRIHRNVSILPPFSAQRNKYPWMVYVRPGNYICGGTLVASKYVVTAAHCLFFDQAGTQPMATSDVQVAMS